MDLVAWLLKEHGIEPEFIVLDAGALPVKGSKQDPFYLLPDVFPSARIAAIEVDPVLCAELNRQASRGVRYFPVALGRRAEKRTLYETAHPMCSSLFEPDERWSAAFNNLDVMRLKIAREVDTISLDEFARSQGIPRFDLLKLDIQGAELDVLRGADALLENTLAIATEVGFVALYKGQPLFADVDAFLRERGFVLHKLLSLGGRGARPFVMNKDPNQAVQHMWADALYVRDFFALPEFGLDALYKLAVVFDLYDSPDMAHRVLVEIDGRTRSSLAPTLVRQINDPA
jgi:FkbM family methyltransferase